MYCEKLDLRKRRESCFIVGEQEFVYMCTVGV